jgi:hypothetical protein
VVDCSGASQAKNRKTTPARGGAGAFGEDDCVVLEAELTAQGANGFRFPAYFFPVFDHRVAKPLCFGTAEQWSRSFISRDRLRLIRN